MHRYRTTGQFIVATQQREYSQWADCSQAAETQTAIFNQVKVGEKKEIWDVVTKNFHKLSAQGHVIMSPMLMRVKTSEHDAGIGIRRESVNTINCSGTLRRRILRNQFWTGTHYYGFDADGIISPIVGLISPQEVNDLVLEYSTQVLAERCRPDNNLFETMAEFDKSVAMIPNFMKGIRSRIPKGTRKMLEGTLASAWLSYRYGVMPLIRDTYAVIEGLKKLTGRIRETTRSKSPELIRTLTSVKAGPGSTASHEFAEFRQHKVTIRCMSLDEYERTARHAIGIDFSKLITTPWELLPYSFVIDWFANVGDYINSLIPQFGCRQLGSCVTVNDEQSLTITHLRDLPVSGWTILTPSSGSYRSAITERRRIVGPLQAKIMIRNDFRFRNMARTLDSIALVLARVRG